MKFDQMYQSDELVLSVEIFPPKTEKGVRLLFEELEHIKRHQPAFISVTYGAGGSTRQRTLDLVKAVRHRIDIETVPHLTCVGASQSDLSTFLDDAEAQGAENIVALRGDPPKGETVFRPAADGFGHANELVAFIRQRTDFGIAVAGYPEGHQECKDWQKDIAYLKQKVDAGADLVLTQLFYDNTAFFRFREAAVQAGIHVPIVPGILPIVKFKQVQRITALCGATIPDQLTTRLIAYPDDSHDQKEAGLAYAVEQCQELLDDDVPGLHIFSLNNGHITSRLVNALSDYF